MPDAVVLGIDPGTRVTGWGVVAVVGGEPRGLACDIVAPAPRLPLEQRLYAIYRELGELIRRYAPDAVAIEEPFVGENVRSAMAVGQARTAAMLAAAAAGLPVASYPPARVKAAVAGHGRGDKEQVRAMLGLQLGMQHLPDDLNATDALAVALCHALALRAAALVGGA